jgi:mRNA-degrading endonuclease toxin of MazEF toxin-antitoxin module
MPAFEVWDIVRVPFPYVDRPIRQHRPALVVAGDESEVRCGLLWLMMITSALNRGWPGDVTISDLRGTGLPIPSIIRPAKLTTIDARDADRLGVLAMADRAGVAQYLRDRLLPVFASG